MRCVATCIINTDAMCMIACAIGGFCSRIFWPPPLVAIAVIIITIAARITENMCMCAGIIRCRGMCMCSKFPDRLLSSSAEYIH